MATERPVSVTVHLPIEGLDDRAGNTALVGGATYTLAKGAGALAPKLEQLLGPGKAALDAAETKAMAEHLYRAGIAEARVAKAAETALSATTGVPEAEIKLAVEAGKAARAEAIASSTMPRRLLSGPCPSCHPEAY